MVVGGLAADSFLCKRGRNVSREIVSCQTTAAVDRTADETRAEPVTTTCPFRTSRPGSRTDTYGARTGINDVSKHDCSRTVSLRERLDVPCRVVDEVLAHDRFTHGLHVSHR